MNWSMMTFMSLPQARSITPIAAVVLPLPVPVLTMTSPLFMRGPVTDCGPGSDFAPVDELSFVVILILPK